MSEQLEPRTVSLGSVDPAGSRHQGRRSAVALTDDLVVAGTADGTVRAFDRETLVERWRDGGDGAVVSAVPFDGGVTVGERGPTGAVRVYDDTGSLQWRYETADDVGAPQKETRFFLPFVVDLAVSDDRLYVAARRYERRGDCPEGERRHFESGIYAFDRDSTERWRYETDASPISLAVDDDRVAVAYNRCTGDHQHGLCVLDATTGDERMLWDPGTAGQRRVGDVSLLEDGLVVTCHGDYRGYRLDGDGAIRWVVDLATSREKDGETVYAYPNHAHATESGIVFVTGNTYPEEGRETDVLHPEEHTAFGYTPDGEQRWTASVEGFASGFAAAGDRLAVPCAQNFRRRDASAHGCRLLDVSDGQASVEATDGIVTAAALTDSALAVLEEPVVYHDDGEKRGAYRLHLK